MNNDWVYEKKDFLGAGSFGQVYKAKNSKTGEVAALKILDMKMFNDPFMIDSLKTEINVMKQLKSPNVVRMIDVYTNANKSQTFMVIELCDHDVRSLMNKKGYLPQDQAIEVMSQLMLGFQDLVKHNYIHRDIKPENALVKGNVFKVADFGFATKVDITGKQLLKECVGTPIYMAPQILERHPYSAKSDIWSIGMMFYEMLFGKTPWSCRDMNSLLRNIKSQPLKFPYERPVTDAIKNCLRRCLTVDEQQRIGWNELFSNEIFSKKQQVTQNQTQLNDRCIRILRKLQNVVQSNNIDPKFIFQRFDTDKDQFLDQKEFSQLILAIDQTTPQQDIAQLMERVADKNKKVDYQEFQKLFTEYDFTDLNDRAGIIIKDIQEVIKANNQNIQQIFKQYDSDKLGDLSLEEFSNLIRAIVPGLKDHEIRLIFAKFDRDGNGTISFAEFQYILSKGTGQTQKEQLSKKAQQVLGKLKQIVRQNNLNILHIFKRFDQSGDNRMDEREYYELLKAIDSTITRNEAAGIFHLVDKNNDESISFEEFSQIF
ncbi:hypothetical protein pb186bvf_017661 [Paramecium bursaria]